MIICCLFIRINRKQLLQLQVDTQNFLATILYNLNKLESFSSKLHLSYELDKDKPAQFMTYFTLSISKFLIMFYYLVCITCYNIFFEANLNHHSILSKFI